MLNTSDSRKNDHFYKVNQSQKLTEGRRGVEITSNTDRIRRRGG